MTETSNLSLQETVRRYDYILSGHIVASDGVRDTRDVVSARAADIYGVEILAERIQVVRFSFLIKNSKNT